MKLSLRIKQAHSAIVELRFRILFALGYCAFCPMAQAVVPAPDGGYSGGNTAEGQNALFSLTTGGFNTAVGFLSLKSNAAGSFNTAIGAGTLLLNTADQNTATGAGALFNTTGGFNTAAGAFALFSNTTGTGNVANGNNALFDNTTGGGNTANGAFALRNNTIGAANTADGNGALINNTTGNNNTALGVTAGSGITTANNVIAIGTSAANVNNSCFIGNIRGVQTTNPDAIPALIDSSGQLGTASSSRRYKTDIRPMDKASEKILALKPVTFHYKSDNTNKPEFGLIAEEVAEVNPDLVVRDKNGEIYTVRYDQVNAMLLNEFLKEHKKVQQLEADLAEQRKDFRAAIAELKKETDVKIQKVTAQIELNNTASRIVEKD
jgi:Chaperone of endosialidase